MSANITTALPISRHIAKSIAPFEQRDGTNVLVNRTIGRMDTRNHDPFLLLDEFSTSSSSFSSSFTKPGFPDHPHRGFETVTYMLEGEFRHEDYSGNSGTIGPGDVQWMTAGRGIIHSEMPQTKHTRGLQLWINLPKEHKMCEPQYQGLLDNQIPRATPEDGVIVKVIAGESHGVKSKVYTRTPIMFLDIQLSKNKTFIQSIPSTFTGFIYILEGTAFIGDEDLEHFAKKQQTLILSENGADTVKIRTGDNDAHFVLIAGEPIREPVVQIGLFVMNTKEEVYATYQDYRDGVNGFERSKK